MKNHTNYNSFHNTNFHTGESAPNSEIIPIGEEVYEEEMVEVEVVEEADEVEVVSYAGQKISVSSGARVRLRNKPTTESAVITTLSSGDKVTIVDAPNLDWYEVSLDSDPAIKGFVMSKFVENV